MKKILLNVQYMFGDEQFYASWFVFLHWIKFQWEMVHWTWIAFYSKSILTIPSSNFFIFSFSNELAFNDQFEWPVWVTLAIVVASMKEPEPMSAQWRMNGKWSGNSFLLGFSSLANYGNYLSYSLFTPPNNSQAGC